MARMWCYIRVILSKEVRHEQAMEFLAARGEVVIDCLQYNMAGPLEVLHLVFLLHCRGTYKLFILMQTSF